MSSYYGKNATKRDVVIPSQKLNTNENGGRVRRMYDSIVLTAELAISDTVAMMKLPMGAKIIGAKFVAPVATGGGPAGKVEVGYEGDTDALFADTECDFGAGAIDADMSGSAAAYNAEMAKEMLVFLTCTEASLISVGATLELEVLYVLD